MSLSLSPNGVPTGASLGGSFSKGRRTYTDTPTTIIADDDLDIYVGRNTMLSGAGIWSKTKKLKLDTGDLVYDNYVDKDLSIAVSANLNLNFQNMAAWRASGSAQYSNVAGITFATLGDGDINIRNRPNLDISALNSNPANMQRITSKTSFSIDVPELNLAALSKDIKDARNFLNTLTKGTPDDIKKKGKEATDYYEDLMLNGASDKVLRQFIASGSFETSLNMRKIIASAQAAGHQPGAAEIALVMQIEGAIYQKSGTGDVKIVFPCPTNGATGCGFVLSQFLDLL